MGLLNDTDFMGQFGAGLLSQSGPSMMPIGLGQAIGNAYAPAQKAMREAQEFELRKKVFAQQQAQQLMQQQLHQMQIKKAEQEMAEEQRQIDFANAIAGGKYNKQVQAPIPGDAFMPAALESQPFQQVTVQDDAAMQRDMIAAFPGLYAKNIMANAFKQDEAFTLKPGERRYKGSTVIAEGGPDIEKQPEFVRLLSAWQAMPEGPQKKLLGARLQTMSSHAPAASANVTIQQEKEENKAVGKAFGESYADIQKAGFSAQSKINRIERLNSLLDGVETGKFTPLGTEIASAAASIGLKIDPKLGNKQAAQALSNEIALELRNPSGGAGMPGALSDKDREFLVSMVPGLATTKEGRAMISDTMKKLAKRDQDVAKIAADYRRRNKTFDEGFYDELRKFSESNPLFNTQPKPATSGGRAKFLGFE